LLRDRAAALPDAAAAHVGDERPRHAARIDPPVAIEAPVLDRNERGRGERIELRDVDRRLLDRAAQRDRMPVVAEEKQGRVGERLERTRQGCGDDQPQESHGEQRRHRVEDERPAAAALAALSLGRRGRRRKLGNEGIGQLFERHPVASPDHVPFGQPHFTRTH
jgi:hypothetical protein